MYYCFRVDLLMFKVLTLFVLIHLIPSCHSTVTFTQANYTFNVFENNALKTVLGNLVATSSDGQAVSYFIVAGNLNDRFVLDQNNGTLRTNSSLNHEVTTEHRLLVEGRAGSMVGTAFVIVYVLNVDDISPICDSNFYHIYVSDDTPHSPPHTLLNISCSDTDSLSLSYTIQTGNDQLKFQLSEEKLLLVSALNHSLTSSYSLSIRVSDGATMPQHISVRIQILPDPNLPPVFTQNGNYTTALYEDSALVAIAQVSLTPAYATSPDVVSYSLFSGDLYRQFSLNSSTGVLSLQSPLDRENVSFYSLSILAFDQSVYPVTIRTAIATVNVTVLDVNDNKPGFDPANLSVTVSRDTPPSTPFSRLFCSDPDSGENSTIASYSLFNDFVSIDSTSGVISTTNTPFPPFSDAHLTFHMIVSCSDSGVPALNGSAVLEILVRQSNSHSPHFAASSAAFEVEENLYLVGTYILQVTATDDDTNLEGSVSYALTGGADISLFFIPAAAIGHLHTSIVRFDRETKCCYQLEITATDGALEGFKKSSSIIVTINVLDENDNRPTFILPYYFLSIFNNNTAGMPLTPVRCNDSDSGLNSEIIYSLNYNPDDKLIINSTTGEVSLATEIRLGSNPTTVNSYYITCVDRGTPPLSSVVAYSLQIVPVDEHPPVFEQKTYSVAMLPENSQVGTFVIQVAASDQDATNAGRELEYAISTGNELNHFSIGTTSGNITVYGELNATATPSYTLVVRATDPTSALIDEASVIIHLFNVNEHAPVLQLLEQYNLAIPENSPSGVEIAKIFCLDLDDILPDNITYSIVDPTTSNFQEFVIDSNGMVTTSNVSTDCETRELYDIILLCSDNEFPPLTAQISIRIRIDGVNEFPPRWLISNFYIFDINEYLPLYSEIIHLYPAYDQDCGVDGDIRTYELTSDPVVADIVIPWFNVTHDGRVYTKSYIDPDILPGKINIAVIQVIAFDNGNPSLSTLDSVGSVAVVATIYIQIINKNDKAPEFLHSNPILIRIDENFPPAEVFYTVQCTDPDGFPENPLILPQGSPEPFSIVNGDISLTPGQLLDYESAQQYDFYLNCSDGVFSTSIHVTVLIRPLNDNPIHFGTNFYQFNLSRTAALGETIGTVDIIDDDIGEVDFPTVVIINSTEPLNPLTINRLGVLTLSVALDTHLLDELQSLFYIDLICDDGVFNDTTLIKISFVEGNLNSPQFSQTIYLFTILEVTIPSTSVGILVCTDLDSGANGEVDFEISQSSPQNDFSIRSDGTLEVLNSLNASLNAGYNLLVTCFDHGSPVRSNTTTVSISVTGGNNCPPVFIHTNTYYANISEDAPLGSFVGQVFTTDCDIGIHGVPTYLSLSHLNQFTVSATDGKIYLKGKLDRETGEVIQLVIQAKDTYFNTSQIFTIFLLDINDNYPTCTPSEYYITVPETASHGTFIEEFNCNDPDKGNNGKLTYTALTANSPFFLLQNGSVYLQSSPLLTNATDHEFHVEVSDNGIEEHSIEVILYVSVAPENLFSPQFQGGTSFFISISEVTLLGTLIFTFLATDADTGFYESKVTYSIFSGNIGITFQIHPDEGKLTLNSPLDFTRTSQYELFIRASDGAALNPKSTMATITISVDEVNRFFPVCNPSQYIVYVAEGVIEEIAQLVCSDEDGADIAYTISSENFSSFEINSTLGVLSVVSPLNFESRTNYSLAIHVSDGQLNITVQVNIFVSPVNEFPPQFSSPLYLLSFLENSTVPSILVTLTAQDLDRDSTTSKHGQVEYSIESGNEGNLFTIGRSNGAIYLGQKLDFETNTFHNLTIVAKDQAQVSLSSSCRVEIFVNNVNDVEPKFDVDLYIFSINDTLTSSSSVGRVSCTDVDFAPSRTQLEYSFTSTTSSFSLHPLTGLITLAVDASEISQTTVDLVISCSDGELFGFSQFIVSIESGVTGVVLEQTIYTFSVNESLSVGSSIGQVSLLNSSALSVSYRLSGLTSLFSIDADGIIKLAGALDFELQASHSFSVQVSTDDFLTYTAASVIISVNDTNDNSPIILNAPLILSMEELTTEGIPLLQIVCQDLDSGSNGDTYLLISSGNEERYFSLSLSGSFQLNRSIDYESISEDPILRLQVTCFDKGTPANSLTTNLTYFVLPSNEHGPVFQNTPYSIFVREDLQIGSTVFTVRATDADRGANHNIVFYQIAGGGSGDTFLISSASGDILLAKSLDHESISSYQLTVTAVDKERLDSGAVDLTLFTDEEIIPIQVIDINDHAPEFSFSFYLATIDEGVLADTFVHSVTCTDLDEGGAFLPLFSLSGPGSESFSISSFQMNGIIKTNTTISYQAASTYLLTITCFDSGVPLLSIESNILITVRNLDQLCPVFNQSSARVQLSESVSVGTFILQMNASYPNGEDNDILFVLLNSILNPFIINQTSGQLFTTDPLDFETQRIFTLEILATNPSATCNNTANVLVELINVNEHSPVFSQNSFSIEVSEAAVPGSNILLLHCSDRDDFAADTSPSILIQSGNLEEKFSVQEQRLVLLSALDIETEQNYTLVINCTDGGPGERSTSAGVFISVQSVNEFPPLFQNETYQVSISETAPTGFEVLMLVATDRDSHGHNDITYSIVSGNDKNKFILNSDKLLVLDILDFETLPSYSLSIRATDSIDPSEALTAFSTVRIDLIDDNDNPPILLPAVAFITLQENTTVGSNILQLSCSDPDAFQNNSLILRIDSGNPAAQFILSPSNQLQLNSPLDFSSVSLYSLSISCRDSSLSPKQDSSRIVINVVNTISEAITFLNTPYSSVIPDTSPVGSIVLSISAIDPDSDSSDHLRFSLVNEAEVPFIIESLSGEIRTVQSLLPYSDQVLVLQIKATDNNNPTRIKFEVASITINRTSNSAPDFERDNYFLNVSELAIPSTILSVLFCYDNDSDTVEYSIQSGNINDSFVLTALTGSLAVKSPLNYESTESYSLTISCVDNGSPPLSTTARVLISVDPENEFTPTFTSNVYGPISLSEDALPGVDVTTVTAVDSDADADGLVSYRITEGNTDGHFVISSSSGRIQVAQLLDFEQISSYQLKVEAADSSPTPRSSTATVDIQLTDVNDNCPQFTGAPYFAQIPSTAGANYTVVMLECSDADSGELGRVNISLVASAQVLQDFQINSEGVVTLRRNLSIDSSQVFSLTPVCSDNATPPCAVSTILTVTSADSNLAPPVFSAASYNITVSEAFPLLTPIFIANATDTDSGTNGIVSYYLVDSDLSLFSINSETGELRLVSPLDFESSLSHTLTIQATDGTPLSPNRMSSQSRLTVYTSDVNDNRPFCGETIFTALYPDSATVGYQIIQLNCTDPDQGPAGLSYSLFEDYENLFAISNQGLLTVTASLPTNVNISSLIISVSDNYIGGPAQTTNVTIRIVITGRNDFCPQFSQTDYSVNLGENATLGRVVLSVSALDADRGVGGVILYSIIGGNDLGHFAVSRYTGEIILMSGLDREIVSSYLLLLRASDDELPSPCTNETGVSITVTDANDNRPCFSQPFYSKTLPADTEVSSSVLSVTAQDRDIGTNRDVSYSLIPISSPASFSIDTLGLISLSQNLSESSATLYQYSVVAEDGGYPALSCSSHLTFYIQPGNIYAPIFYQKPYSITLLENSLPSVPLLYISASDRDSEYVLYSILSGNEDFLFRIHPFTGAVSLNQQLDFEYKPEYRLLAEARDVVLHEGTSLTDTTEIIITVINRNDNTPFFEIGSYSAGINSSLPIGSQILTVGCIDSDLPPYGNTTLSISSGNSNGYFALAENGAISVAQSVVALTVERMTINCTDNVFSVYANVLIVAVDSSNSGAQFSRDLYEWYLPENSQLGTSFLGISAGGANTSDPVSYNIVSGNELYMFSIDLDEGTVQLVNPVDRELTSEYLFALSVSSGGETSYAILHIIITDINDNFPVISTDATVTLLYSFSSPGTVATFLSCHDIDSGLNSQTSLAITAGNEESLFTLDISGALLLNRTVNYQSVHSLTISCSDSGIPSLSSTIVVTIEILPVNSYSPDFEQDQIVVDVLENLSVGSILANITAVDRDEGAFGEVSLSIISGNEFNLFVINPVTGGLSSRSELDFESAQSHTLTIQAEDGGYGSNALERSRAATARVTVRVFDVNDNAPHFDSGAYSVHISSAAAPGSELLRGITCTDADSELNGDVDYSFVNDSTPFYIDNGSVFLALPLASFVQDSFSLTLECKDRGSPPLVTSAPLLIIIRTDVLAPEFSQNNYSVSLSEAAEIGTEILAIIAEDRDLGNNGAVTYQLVDCYSPCPFTIHTTTGLVSVVGPLDYETLPSYLLRIQALDLGTYSHTSEATLLIIIINENDNSPEFDQTIHSVSIQEGASVNTPLLSLQCTDKDSNDLSFNIIYGLQGTDAFRVSREGILLVSGQLDYESISHFSLQVQCSEGGDSVSTVVQVTVTNTNEHAPIFNKSQYNISVLESLPFGSVVLTVLAVDGDADALGEVTYSIVGGNPLQSFGILSIEGTIFLTDSLDYETTPSFSLIVFATDRDGLVGRTNIIVEVLNVNDNAPFFKPSLYSRVLSIDEEVGRNITQLYCFEGDGSSVVYCIESGNTGDYFAVSMTGIISVSHNLTGSNQVLILSVSCSDQSHQPAAIAIISISILRDSDCPIQFTSTQYTARVSEDVSINYVALTLSVNGSSSDVTYLIEPSSVPFFARPQGTSVDILVSSPLDADSQSVYIFNVKATPDDVECDNPPQISVTILIEDVNEFAPVIMPSVKTVVLGENLITPRLIAQFQCNDSDASNNAVAFIDPLLETSKFNIDSNGRVTLNVNLDYETQQIFTFEILCQDSAVSPKTGTATLHVMVSSQNEFVPQFSLPSYQFFVIESVLPGYSIGRVQATDGDSLLSGDGQIDFSLRNTSQFYSTSFGDIIVNTLLDRESVSRINLTAVATDRGNVSYSATAAVSIVVGDANDNPPQFHPLAYSVSQNSNRSLSEPVAAIRCTDPDEGTNSNLQLSFQQGFNLSYALTNQVVGEGEINATLVALSAPSSGLTTFRIQCTDSGNVTLSSTAQVSILVSTECYGPQLTPMYHATLPEDTAIGTTVVNTSAQYDPLCPHQFHILSGEYGAFAINQTEGNIYTINSLDFETVPSYQIIISLISLTSTGAKSSTATVFLSLSDINDNSPVIEPALQTVTHAENTPVDQVIAALSCSDLDSGDALRLAIESGNGDSKFEIDEQGVLSLLNSLDFETTRVYDLSIICAEVGTVGLQHTSTAQLTVLVSAVNDNDPSFDLSVYTASIAENTPIGTTVLAVSATDRDLTTPHNKTLFGLSGPNSNIFRLKADGSLVTADFLDAETAPSGSYQFQAVAYNEVPGASTATATIIISLTDVNEDPPICGGGIIDLLLEPGTYTTQSVGGSIACTDPDISAPSFSVVLTADASNDFSLVLTGEVLGSSVSLKLSGTISYPKHLTPNQYTLSVSDGGSPALTGDTLVYVRVKPPPGALSFIPNARSLAVREDFSLGNELIDVGALLTGDKRELAAYTTSSPLLAITSDGMVTLATTLDFETRTSHNIEIRAEVSPEFNLFTLTIQVSDVNDNKPKFLLGIIRSYVREDVIPFTVITTISATDADSSTNGAVSYSQVSSTGPTGLFTVSPTGIVTVTSSLDREDTPQYSIQMRATDGGSPSLSAIAVLLISVSDVNDNPPVFQEDSSGLMLTVEHTIPRGTVIHTFQVSDLDLNPTFLFSIRESSGAQAAFDVSSEGALFIRDDLVNIPSQTFEFSVEVSDGIRTDSIPVSIIVTLMADVELTLRENSPIGSEVWNATTFSKGSYVPTANAQFSLILGNFKDRFAIDSISGVLKTIGEIDYENASVYTFIIEIEDPANTVNSNFKVSVYLLVLDENDNSPEFTLLAPSVAIVEGRYITPEKLAQVTARDLDSGVYAQLEYHLLYPNTGQEASDLPFYFTFDGSLYVQGDVDRETGSTLSLSVRARDKSQDPLSTTTPILISILDVNDNSPSFTDLVSPINILNNHPDNSIFYNFYVSDPDEGENGTVQFNLVQIFPESPLYFGYNLNQDSGLVTLIKIANLLGLSEDELFHIQLRLTASDQGSPPRGYTQDVTVAVKPYDIRPFFQSDFYWVDLIYSAPVGTALLTVQLVVELDSIYFQIDEVDKGYFTIDSGGTIYSVSGGVRKFSNFPLKITAINRSGEKSSSSYVIVNTLASTFITELLLNISYQNFTSDLDSYVEWLDDQVPSRDTFLALTHHIQDGLVNISLYVVQGRYFPNQTSPEVTSTDLAPKPFLSVETVCAQYYSPLTVVLDCQQRFEVLPPDQEGFQSLIWLVVLFIIVILLLLAVILLLCLGAYIYYKRQEEKILMDETIFEHPYMIARPLGAYEMQQELRKLGKRSRAKPTNFYENEERGHQLGRGREYHSSDENIDERFLDEYASSESSISVYGQDYSKFEQMEAWQKYRNMGPLLRQMVERWRDGDNIVLENDESKGEMSA